ncbi:histidine phosphatase family protein [Candidatus Saccharibacteria bacterium]|nr:histidine phosphatase family protein [Candidatus Saccharibacteria bacterium]
MSVRITYFVHGTTTDNENRRSTGWNPGGLSDLGIQQSKDLARLFNSSDFDAIFCSDLKRAIDSAALNFGKDVAIKDARLRECNYGDLNGAPESQVIDKDHITEPFPNGESLMDVEVRLRNFCQFLLEKYNGQHIAIVAHKAPQLALEVITNGKTWPEALAGDWRKTKSWQPGWEYTVETRGI